MNMSRSPYIDNVVLTSKHSGKRTEKVQAFVIHHMAAKWTGKRCAEYFRDTPSRQASANYCIGYDGDVALNVEEENRAWTSSSNWADQRAITYELANSKTGEPWEVSDATIRKAIVMLAEQHKRYGLKKATYTGDTSGTLWRHDWFAKTNCPGTYLGGKFAYIAQEVNKLLDVKTPIVSGAKSYKLVTTVNGYINAADARNKKNAKAKVAAGNYAVFSEANGMINVTTKSGVPGSWINPSENKAPVSVSKPSASNQSGIVKSYKEDGIFYTDPRPDDRIYVRDQPSTKGKVVAEYYIYGVNESLSVEYHTVHLGNGYVWLQYDRKRDGKVIGQGYIPCRTYSNGKYGALWGTIK